jgi:hypothetical protein
MTRNFLDNRIKNVVRVSSGNFLEMYDFIVFGYYAAAIGRTFFPGNSPFASLMLSLMTFGAGFLMRPIGAIVLGAYIDRYGRRAGLLLTLGLMSIGTLVRAARAFPHTREPAHPRLFGRSRTWRSLGLPLRDRDTGPQRLLCQLAICKSAGGGDVFRAARCAVDIYVAPCRHGSMGMAGTVPHRLSDHSAAFSASAIAGGNRCVSRAETHANYVPDYGFHCRKLADCTHW